MKNVADFPAPALDEALELLNAADVAKLIHQPVSWVRSQCRDRAKVQMPHIKRGGRLFFEEKAVLVWFHEARIAYPKKRR